MRQRTPGQQPAGFFGGAGSFTAHPKPRGHLGNSPREKLLGWLNEGGRINPAVAPTASGDDRQRARSAMPDMPHAAATAPASPPRPCHPEQPRRHRRPVESQGHARGLQHPERQQAAEPCLRHTLEDLVTKAVISWLTRARAAARRSRRPSLLACQDAETVPIGASSNTTAFPDPKPKPMATLTS
jgi:hypothetical protein